MRVRTLDAQGDMQFGRGQENFSSNTPAAVAQNVRTRLGEYVGDWFLDTTAGTPWRTQVLGMRTNSTRDPAMRARILGTQGVTALLSYASQIDRASRAYAVQATINTAYSAQMPSGVTTQADIDVRQGR